MTNLKRWRLLGLGAAVVLGCAAAFARPEAPAMEVLVYKTPTCGCCVRWVDHLQDHGLRVVTQDLSDLSAVKKQHHVSERLASCHTAIAQGYVFEGHVPADVVLRFLKERPNAVGLTVPGMPMGTPGMEGPRRDRYDVLTFDQAGATQVYTSR